MRWVNRTFLISGGLAGVLAVTLAAGLRQGLLALLGITKQSLGRVVNELEWQYEVPKLLQAYETLWAK